MDNQDPAPVNEVVDDTEDDDSSYYGISDVEDNSQEDEAAIMVASNNIVNPLGFETESDDHSYLGNMEEVRGRTLLDEGSCVDLPVIVQQNLICVPGQTLPLNVSHPHTISTLRQVIDGNRTFGILSFRPFEPDIQEIKFRIGSTAEIYEYGEQNEDQFDSNFGFRVKAKVRQRFKVINARRQLNGSIIARVEILPENILSDSLYDCRSLSLDKHRLLPTSTAENNSISGGFIRTLLSQKNIYEKQFHVPYSVWPSWVHRSYDVKFVTQRVLQELRTSIFISLGSDAIIPTDPVDLSYWVIQNLPLENNQRLFLLNINCPNQRLRAVLSILQQCEYLCCRECDHPVARQSDIFAMSKEGPQGNYVNPFGHVHETLTVHRVDGVTATTPPSNDFSWFPGYAWSIIVCSYCHTHMGWLFKANSRNKIPTRFWGLCRLSLKPRVKAKEEEGQVSVIM